MSFRACQTFLIMIMLAVTPAFAAHARHTGAAAHSRYVRHRTYTHHVRRARYVRHRSYVRHDRYERRARYARHRRYVRRVYYRHVIRGQRGIAPARATQIQNALIRQHYLVGPASGQWDEATEQAMQKYQADHGWQTKMVPDSRALISLGLGPNHSADGTLLNASTANSAPATPNPPYQTLASIHIIPN